MRQLLLSALLGFAVAPAVAKNMPNEDGPRMLYGAGHHMVAVYFFKLDFYNLPAAYYLGVRKGRHLRLLRRIGNGPSPSDPEIPLASIQGNRTRTISFKHGFSINPLWPKQTPNTFLACIDRTFGFPLRTNAEAKEFGTPESPASALLSNDGGQFEDFCGVISLDGTIVYQFDFKQSLPGQLLDPIGMTEDGKHAAVFVGEKVLCDECPGGMVGNPREVLLWDFPDHVRKQTLPKGTTETDLRNQFLQGKL